MRRAEPTLDGAEGWFSWPVIDGQKICPSAEMVYCWQVSAVETGYALLDAAPGRGWDFANFRPVVAAAE